MKSTTTRKSSEDSTNWVKIVVVLLLIFIIGYAFYKNSETPSAVLKSPEEPDDLQKLEKLRKEHLKLKNQRAEELERAVRRRRNYFLITRLLLVIIVLTLFFLIQDYWKFEPYQHCHVMDNLRNYLSSIVIGFTTIAFIAKGNLKSFKEAIENMAIDQLFPKEKDLKFEVEFHTSVVLSLEEHIRRLKENGKS